MQLFETVNSLLTQFVLNSSAIAASSQQFTPLVDVKNGTLAGVHSTTFNQDFFLGVPFATPPVGKHRLIRPQPPQAWNGTKDVTAYGPWCSGMKTGKDYLPGFSQSTKERSSEDCLHVNIVRPASSVPKHEPMPVLVWFHGGGWMTGSSVDRRYNGSFLVQESVHMETPIIYVSANYRLNRFGFLVGSMIEEAGLTNIGLRDQRQALLWIQENIAAFGGDPNRVTIFGESGGAGAVGQQLIAFGGKNENLFHGAIMQSGSAPLAKPLLDARGREEVFQNLLNVAGCSDSEDVLACLQAVPADILELPNSSLSTLFAVNDDFFPELPSKLLESGKFLRVPVIAGVNRNEGTTVLAAGLRTHNASLDNFEAFAALIANRGFPPAAVRKLWDLYGDEVANPTEAGVGAVLLSKYGIEFPRASLFMGDDMFAFPRRFTNQIWSRFGVPSYSYFFDIEPEESYLDPAVYGVPHFAEIPYVFGNTEGVGWDINPIPQGPEKTAYVKMAKLISRMWISFVVSGSPNNHQLADVDKEWPVYSNDNPESAWFKLSGLSTQKDTWREEAMALHLELQKGREW